MDENMKVFDRRLVRRHRDRAAAGFSQARFLFEEIARRLAERLDEVARHFPVCLDLGCRDGTLSRSLAGREGVEWILQCDLSPAMAGIAAGTGRPTVAADEEHLPFAPASFDLVTSVLSLHWTNDLPGALIQARQALRPDGLFLVAMLGGGSLAELREALLEAEIAEEDGASPRVSPFADLRDAAGLLQRAGFALPVADLDRITVSYPNALKLMQDLRAMGETNAVLTRRRTPTRRATLLRAAAIYQERHGDADGRIPATFDVLYLTGWAPDPSQQQPLKPGSASGRLAEALDSVERTAGEKARPKGG